MNSLLNMFPSLNQRAGGSCGTQRRPNGGNLRRNRRSRNQRAGGGCPYADARPSRGRRQSGGVRSMRKLSRKRNRSRRKGVVVCNGGECPKRRFK